MTSNHRSAEGPAASGSSYAPVRPSERIQVLDLLRGFALLLIFTFNMFIFSGYVFLSPEETKALWSYPADRVALFLRYIFTENSQDLFAFLFGVGFGIQVRRARDRGVRWVPGYIRRLVILLLIGLAHAILLWGGDILVLYALLGFLLIPFRKASDRTLLTCAITIYLLPIPLYALMMIVGMPEPYAVASGLVGDPALFMRWMDAFTTGNYFDVIGGNAAFLIFWWTMFVVNLYWPNILGMFLLGLYVGRGQLFKKVADRPGLLHAKLVWGLGLVGFAGNVVFAILTDKGVYYPASYQGLIMTIIQYISMPALCLFYVTGFTLLVQGASWRRRLEPITALGRMTLTNYLMQSFLCIFIFYGLGLGLFMKVGAAPAMAIAVTIWLLQIAVSRWWLTRFSYGPVEWVWRQLTYGTRLPLRIATSDE